MEHISDTSQPDTMMIELNEVRSQIGQQLSQLSIEERLAYHEEQMRTYGALCALEFVADPSVPRAVRAVSKQTAS
jgi:pimeloyl-CoA synthetase